MKQKIVWITPDYFYDVDWPIIEQLKEYYSIRWYVIWGAGSLREKPKNDNISSFIQLNYRYRDIRIIGSYWRIIRDIIKYSPAIIYNAFLGLPFFLPMLFSSFNRNKVIYEGHEINPYVSANHDRLSVWYAIYNIRRVGHVQVFSRHAETEFYKLYPGKECTYVPMVTKNYGYPNHIIDHGDRIVFLFFGGLRYTKRFDVLLNAFLSMDDNQSHKAELWVYGNCEGHEKEHYLNAINGHSNIKALFDFVPDVIVPDLFCSASYLVLPYQQITQSGPMMIAYNYNLPMIASDLEGFKERIVDGENGYLFKRNDVEDLKRVLIHCINQSIEDYQRIKNNAKAFAESEYSMSVVIEKYRRMLDSFIAKNERR